MPIGATIGAIGAIGAAGVGAYASGQASSQQVAAQRAELAQQQSMFNTAQGALQPYYSAGANYGGVLSSLLTPGPNQTAALSQIPGFQFAQDWGQKAVQNLGTTTGLGGNVLTAGANYATGLAQQGLSTIVNPLVSLYQTGAGAAGALSQAAGTFSGQESSALTGIGQAQAAGTLGTANALGTGLQGATSSLTNSLLLNRLLNNNANGIYGGNAGVTSSLPIPSFGGGGSYGAPQ